MSERWVQRLRDLLPTYLAKHDALSRIAAEAIVLLHGSTRAASMTLTLTSTFGSSPRFQAHGVGRGCCERISFAFELDGSRGTLR